MTYADEVACDHARPKETAARLSHLLDRLGSAKLSELNGRAFRDYVASRGAVQAAGRELEDLRAAINHSYREGYIAAPVPVRLPSRSPARLRWLARAEAAALIKAARKMHQTFKGGATKRKTGEHIARFILIALYTATRAGAVCDAAIRPTVGHGYVDLKQGLYYRQPPGAKITKKRAPPVPLPDRLLAHLRRWERKGISQRFVVEWNGEPVRRVSKGFRTARKSAGLGPDVVPHTLRHTAATWLMQAGVDLWEAAGYVGMTVETLERVYGHHHPTHLENARRAIARQLPDRNNRTEREHPQPDYPETIGNARGSC